MTLTQQRHRRHRAGAIKDRAFIEYGAATGLAIISLGTAVHSFSGAGIVKLDAVSLSRALRLNTVSRQEVTNAAAIVTTQGSPMLNGFVPKTDAPSLSNARARADSL